MSKILVDQIRSNSASSDAITLDGSGNVTVPGNITLNGTATGFPKGKAHNLVINGAMQVAQRGTSSTTNGYGSVDRFEITFTGTDENPTQSQVDVASGTTPYTLGFRKALKITNGNQTSGFGAGDHIRVDTKVEAQDLTTSGWNFKSSSSYITLSYWVKSSVAQEFFGYLYIDDTPYKYGWSLGSLSADTWTKITVTIPGNSNLGVNNDNGAGCWINLLGIWGTDKTASDAAPNTWGAWDGAKRSTDQATTWYTTNDATFEITGVQLEVGASASDFNHRSFAQELQLCHRYFQELHIFTMVGTNTNVLFVESFNFHGGEMRSTPTITGSRGATGENKFEGGGGDYGCTLYNANNEYIAIYGGGGSVNNYVRGSFDCSAEL